MGLAPLIVQQIFEIITEINDQGTTILLVEQNAAQALQLSHRAYVLETGSVVKSARRPSCSTTRRSARRTWAARRDTSAPCPAARSALAAGQGDVRAEVLDPQGADDRLHRQVVPEVHLQPAPGGDGRGAGLAGDVHGVVVRLVGRAVGVDQQQAVDGEVRNVDFPLSRATRTRSYSPRGSHSACVPMIESRCTRSPTTLYCHLRPGRARRRQRGLERVGRCAAPAGTSGSRSATAPPRRL